MSCNEQLLPNGGSAVACGFQRAATRRQFLRGNMETLSPGSLAVRAVRAKRPLSRREVRARHDFPAPPSREPAGSGILLRPDELGSRRRDRARGGSRGHRRTRTRGRRRPRPARLEFRGRGSRRARLRAVQPRSHGSDPAARLRPGPPIRRVGRTDRPASNRHRPDRRPWRAASGGASRPTGREGETIPEESDP